MIIKDSDLFVCADCYHYHETGEARAEHTTEWRNNYECGYATLTAQGLQIVSGDSDHDNDFSFRRCDLCGARDAGSRHHLATLRDGTPLEAVIQVTEPLMTWIQTRTTSADESATTILERAERVIELAQQEAARPVTPQPATGKTETRPDGDGLVLRGGRLVTPQPVSELRGALDAMLTYFTDDDSPDAERIRASARAALESQPVTARGSK